MSADRLLTPTARRILAELRRERECWDEAAGDDTQNTFLRHGATSRRDQLDFVIQKLSHDLPDVEREAVEIEVSEAARMDAALDAVEGVPA